MSDTVNSWAPWEDQPWCDGMPVMARWIPEFKTTSADIWIKFRAPAGAGWMVDGEQPWPGRTGRDLTPVPPYLRPKGPAMPVATVSEAWLAEHGLLPAPGDAERALAELDLRRRSRQPPLISTRGSVEQHTAIGQYIEPSSPRPPSFQDA